MNAPADWKLVAVRELGHVMAGRQRSARITTGRQRPYLRVANVFDARIDSSDVFTMPFTDKEFERYHLQPGDILLNEGQSIELVGRAALYEGDPQDCCFQNTLIRFRADPNADPKFALSLFQFLQRNGRFAAIAARTTSIAHLGVNRLAELTVSVPSSLAEQQFIGKLGEELRCAIGSLEKLIRAKQRFKRGLMQQLLTGKRQLNEFQGEPWREYCLGDLFTERVETSRTDLPLMSITADRGVIPRDELARRDTSNADKSKYLRIAPGDIGYNTMRMWQGVSALSMLDGIVSPAYTICEPGQDVHGQFAAYLFKLPVVVDRFRRYSQGLVDDTLNLKFHHFAKIRVQIPRLEVQRAIAEVLTAIDDEIHLLKQLRDALDRQRRGVMELLLTGKVRVPT